MGKKGLLSSLCVIYQFPSFIPHGKRLVWSWKLTGMKIRTPRCEKWNMEVIRNLWRTERHKAQISKKDWWLQPV